MFLCIFIVEAVAHHIDSCPVCSDNATCEDGKCVCKEGFKGDGETCEGDMVNYIHWHFKYYGNIN